MFFSVLIFLSGAHPLVSRCGFMKATVALANPNSG